MFILSRAKSSREDELVLNLLSAAFLILLPSSNLTWVLSTNEDVDEDCDY